MKDMMNLKNGEGTELRVIRLDKSGDISLVYNPNEPGLYGIVVGRNHPAIYLNADIVAKIARLPVDPQVAARMTELEAEQMGITGRDLEFYRRIDMIVTMPVNAAPEEPVKPKEPAKEVVKPEVKTKKPAKKKGR